MRPTKEAKPLPIGVQIIAAPWREDIPLRIAHALEQAGVVAAGKPSLEASKKTSARK
jgi:Asp-tRNA(Asn)/Glu-tRNA(Gln) amidotransferase A subunit family amidase